MSGWALVRMWRQGYGEHMFRYLVAHVPTFRLDRCGWSPRQLVALVAEEKNALRVMASTAAATRQGVRRGMSIAAARARIPQLETEVLDAPAEAADLQALTAQLLSISPNIAPMPPDVLVAEVSRLSDVRGGQERALIERVRLRLLHLGHRANIVIADDPSTARAVAIWRERCDVIPPGQGAQALATLPLLALELPKQEHARLAGLGLSTIDAFAKLPPAAVARRLGPVGVAAHALAQGRGPAPQLQPWDETGTLSLTQLLPAPVDSLNALIFVLRALIQDCTARLAACGQGATRLEIHLGLDDGGRQTVTLRLGAPLRDAAKIRALVHARLAQLQLARPAVSITVRFPDAAPFDGHQLDLRDPRRCAEAIQDVTARLQDTLGGRCVVAALSIPRHRPEAAWRPIPFFRTTVPAGPLAAATQRNMTHGADPVEAWCGTPTPDVPDRPPILLLPPIAVAVAPPLRALQVNGRWHDIVAHTGPEQLSGEWWRASFDRNYWRTTLKDGRVAWIFREDGQWVLHGWWDR